MKYLILLITELYPNRMFNLTESYSTDEVFNINIEYRLNIIDICYEIFDSFWELENYVYELYEKKHKEL